VLAREHTTNGVLSPDDYVATVELGTEVALGEPFPPKDAAHPKEHDGEFRLTDVWNVFARSRADT